MRYESYEFIILQWSALFSSHIQTRISLDHDSWQDTASNWLFPQDQWCRILRICFLFNFWDIFECCPSESGCTCIFLYTRKGVWSLSMWLSSVSRLLLRATSFMCDKDWAWGSFFKNQIGLWRTRICWDRVIQHDSYHLILVRQEFRQVLRCVKSGLIPQTDISWHSNNNSKWFQFLPNLKMHEALPACIGSAPFLATWNLPWRSCTFYGCCRCFIGARLKKVSVAAPLKS